ncbi:hypothetical protein CVS40_11862 [Lucilia cuprina]|nr:hypothetical protein CVS40_11862 [Lucilia cuprina]
MNNTNLQLPPSQPQYNPSNFPNSYQQRPEFRQTPHSHVDENFAIRADKITSIIQNWNVRFDGSSQGISVDEFLYRVRSLTRENFNNDFSLICRNLHILLAGRVCDWYWRYHKQVEVVEWKEFCEALKYQYKEFKSSFDIHEEIRNRKMKPNESFETFYESVCSMLDKLSTPIPESDLVEILTRNLRPEIRHELLYVPVYSLAHLRKLVQMREHLMESDHFRKSISNRIPSNFNIRRQVAEVDCSQELSPSDSQNEPEISVDAIQQTTQTFKCWNCDKTGHHWEDCLEPRNIFCYGCGMKNTYKPQCSKCANRKLNNSACGSESKTSEYFENIANTSNENVSKENVDKENNYRVIHNIIPYHVRLQKYLEKRKQIFEVNALNDCFLRQPKRSTIRLRRYFKNRKFCSK